MDEKQTTNIVLQVDREIYDKLKGIALFNGMSTKEALNKAISNYIDSASESIPIKPEKKD